MCIKTWLLMSIYRNATLTLKIFKVSQQSSYLAGATEFSPSTGLSLLSPSFLIPFTRFAAVLVLHVWSELVLLSLRVSFATFVLFHSSLYFLSSSTSFCNCSQRVFSCSKLSSFKYTIEFVGFEEWKKGKKKNSLSLTDQIISLCRPECWYVPIMPLN